MELYFLRHGIAADFSVVRHRNDSERPLTTEGRAKMRRITKGMRRVELDFDLILSSPYLRAKQTAEITALELGIKAKLEFSKHLAADGDAQQLLAELKRSHTSKKRILLVGHEPYLSSLISTLIVGSQSIPLVLKKGGLCKLTIDTLRYGPCAQLEWLLTPRQLTSLGKA